MKQSIFQENSKDLRDNPRADELNLHGSDERMMAREYMGRAYGHFRDEVA